MPELHRWLPADPPEGVQLALKRLARGDDIHHVAVMPDVHLAKDVCVGVALATRHTLIPAAVGSDIGCGMAAVGLDAEARLVTRQNAARLLDGLYQRVFVMRHPRRSSPRLPESLARWPLSDPALESLKQRDGTLQFGTLGRGNHFLEFQADQDGALWLMLHSGSRGIGQAIRQFHERTADRDSAGLRVIEASTPAGQAYLNDMGWALHYAALSRRWMVDTVVALCRELFAIEAHPESHIACHHNFVRWERHADRGYWVHRKGAISAQLDEPGIIPGSMGAPSFHVLGRGAPDALCSSSHGAGRLLSRSEAKRRLTARDLLKSMEGVFFDQRLTRRLLEEAPGAYKNIRDVMHAQRELTKVVRTLRPLLAFKGS